MRYLALISFILLSCITDSFADNSFDAWLKQFEQDARNAGITQKTLDDAFASTQPLDNVIELDQKQPESRITLDRYISNIVTKRRVRDGREMLNENRSLLTKIGKKYGVQPRFIVALWGIETGYGHNTGGFSTIDALATLAFDGRRSAFFRDELLNALQILQDEHMPAADMQGSWAGALGQCQFMPSTYLKLRWRWET